MVRTFVLSVLLCAVIGVPVANASIVQFISYCGETNGIGCGCEAGTRVPFADGTASWCMYWDRTGNGVDDSDELVPIGVGPGYAAWNCQTFNGEAFCGLPGNFVSEPAFTVQNYVEEPDQSVYFIKITGENCCWVSDTFRLTDGFNPDIELHDGDFTCTNTACPVGNPPTPVTNLTVSNEQYCTQVQLAWEHDGQDLSGFAISIFDEESQEWEFRIQVASTERTADLPVCADGEVAVSVETINGSQRSDRVSGVGRTYLRRFDSTTPYTREGNDITMNLVAPPFGQYCSAFLFFDLYCGGSHVTRLCQVTSPDSLLLDQITCTLPMSTPSPDCYIVMRDSSDAQFLLGCQFTDTIFFMLDNDKTPVLPREFTLSQNYPNPFNPTTTINFSVPNAGNAELSIFNVVGQRVATLVNGNVNAGQHSIQWNAAAASTGVYFYQLKMGEQLITRKMLLLK